MIKKAFTELEMEKGLPIQFKRSIFSKILFHSSSHFPPKKVVELETLLTVLSGAPDCNAMDPLAPKASRKRHHHMGLSNIF